MDGREIQRLKEEVERKQLSLAGQLRSEFSRFSNETTHVLNSIDAKISERVQEEVRLAFIEIKMLIQNSRQRTGA